MNPHFYFREQEYGNTFWASPTSNPWALSQGLDYQIQSQDVPRFCRFSPKRTRMYLAVDESAEGEAVLETWKIRVF